MKYPFHTVSDPVVGKEATKLLKAVETGKPLVNKRARTTVDRILERRKSASAVKM